MGWIFCKKNSSKRSILGKSSSIFLDRAREGCHHLLSWQMKRSKWEKQVGTLCNCIVDHGDWAFFGVFWYLICIYLYVGSIWRTLLYWRPHYPILNALFTSFYYWMHYHVNFSSTLGLLLTVFLCWMLCWQFYFKIHNAALEVCHHSSLNLLLPSQSWLNVFLLYRWIYCCGTILATLVPPTKSRVSKPRDTAPHLHYSLWSSSRCGC